MCLGVGSLGVVGYPCRPFVYDDANCGPTVLASLIGMNTDGAIEIMKDTYAKGWHGYTNIGHIKKALESLDIQMVKTKEYDDLNKIPIYIGSSNPVLLFLQIEGPWCKKGWRSSYNNTHWTLFELGLVMDVNNIWEDNYDHAEKIGHPQWVDISIWEDEVMPHLLSTIDRGIGWHVRSGYNIIER